MRDEKEVQNLLSKKGKEIERELGLIIRNGQTLQGIKRTLEWLLGEDFERKTNTSLEHLRGDIIR